MARRALNERNIRKLSKSGGGKSTTLTLPIEIVRELGWKSKQKVVVKKRGRGIFVEDWKK